MHSENLQKGDFITVISWQKREHVHDNFLTGQIVVETIQDRSYCGDLLEVLAVDHPFVVVLPDKYRGSVLEMPVSLNLLEVKIQKCSEEYVAALRKK